MNAGDLRHQLYILYDTSGGEPGPDGNPAENWQPITANPVWAAKKGLKGRVFYEAMAAHAEDVVLFVTRNNSITASVTTAMRLCEGRHVTTEIVEGEGEEEDEEIVTTTYDHTYEIIAPPVDPNDMRQWLEIRAREVLQNGG